MDAADHELIAAQTDHWLKELPSLYSYAIAFAAMRLTVLGASLALIGIVLPKVNLSDWFSSIIVSLALMGLIHLSVSMISSINRSIFTIFSWMSWVEEQAGLWGFASNWIHYIKARSIDSGSNAFRTGCVYLNNCGGILSLLLILWHLFKDNAPSSPILLLGSGRTVNWDVPPLACMAALFAAAALWRMNFRILSKEYEPGSYTQAMIDTISGGWNQAGKYRIPRRPVTPGAVQQPEVQVRQESEIPGMSQLE